MGIVKSLWNSVFLLTSLYKHLHIDTSGMEEQEKEKRRLVIEKFQKAPFEEIAAQCESKVSEQMVKGGEGVGDFLWRSWWLVGRFWALGRWAEHSVMHQVGTESFEGTISLCAINRWKWHIPNCMLMMIVALIIFFLQWFSVILLYFVLCIYQFVFTTETRKGIKEKLYIKFQLQVKPKH